MDFLYQLLEMLKLKKTEESRFEKPNGYKNVSTSSYHK